MDAVAAASQQVSAALDESDVMGAQPYVLEVSSPGVDRPLTERRHWLRARRRMVLVALADGTRSHGRLTGVDDDGITIDEHSLTWAQVTSGRVQVEFADSAGPERVED
jgi:ribosome maturation factor RimP